MPDPATHFLRHTPADPAALRARIEQVRVELAAAVARGDEPQAIEHAGDLGAMLTSDRREAEAQELLASWLPAARQRLDSEAAAWLIHAWATTAQYLGRYDEANAGFAEALQRCEARAWNRLRHFVLHHWGRCLAEQRRWAEARSCFERALAVRQALREDRLAASSQGALAELDRLQAQHAMTQAQ